MSQRIAFLFTAVVGTLVAGLSSGKTWGQPLNLRAGDIIVLEQGSVTGSTTAAAIIHIDPASGQQRIVTQGGLLSNAIGQNPNGFTYDPIDQHFYVVDRKDHLIAVDLDGNQTLVTSLPTVSATSIAIDLNGDFIVTDRASKVLRISRPDNAISTIAAGGYLGGANPWAVQLDSRGNYLVSCIQSFDVPGLPSRLVRINADTGEQSLIAETTERQFRDFFVAEEDKITIVMAARGCCFSNDIVVSLDLTTGAFSTIAGKLERALDVDWDGRNDPLILDQCLDLDCGPSSATGNGAVYRLDTSGNLNLVSTGGLMDAPARLLIFPPTCGNQVVEGEEGCDDGNLIDDDGCSSACIVEVPEPVPASSGAGVMIVIALMAVTLSVASWRAGRL